jgi:FkbM family methyltransferase
MALAKERYVMSDSILSPGSKDFLGSFSLGRRGLALGRAVRGFLRKLRDPIQHKVWMGEFIFPLRNLFLRNRPVQIPLGAVSIEMAPEGSTACDIWTGLRCETYEVLFILSALEPGMVFFDVGANAGLFTVSAAKKIGSKQVYAFEPCSSTCKLLKRNLQLNGFADVRVEQVALGDSAGKGVLQVNARGKDGLNTLGHATHPGSQVVGQEEVRIITLDAFLKDRGVARVDVMKVDIEGAELMLFRGARELLERADAPLILYEGFGFLTRGFGYHPVEILWFLESCGYSLFALNGETGAISELKADYRYDSMVIAAKPGHSWLAGRLASTN